jgi:hypothetical protein
MTASSARMFSQRAAPMGADGSVLCGAWESDEEAVESSPEPEPESPPGMLGVVGALGILGAVGALGALGIEILPLGKPTISTYLVAESGLIEDEEAQGENE